MRGQTFLSYALVALATTAYAAPLAVRTDGDVEKREALFAHQLVKIGTVARDNFRREAEEAATGAKSGYVKVSQLSINCLHILVPQVSHPPQLKLVEERRLRQTPPVLRRQQRHQRPRKLS